MSSIIERAVNFVGNFFGIFGGILEDDKVYKNRMHSYNKHRQRQNKLNDEL